MQKLDIRRMSVRGDYQDWRDRIHLENRCIDSRYKQRLPDGLTGLDSAMRRSSLMKRVSRTDQHLKLLTGGEREQFGEVSPQIFRCQQRDEREPLQRLI